MYISASYFTKTSCLAMIASLQAQILFHPLEIIKTRMQSHDGTQKRNQVPQYRSLKFALNHIYSIEGFKGFYRGLYISLLSQTLIRGFFFGRYFLLLSYESLKQELLIKQIKYPIVVASILAGFLTSIVTQPLNTIKTRLLLNVTPQNRSIQYLFQEIQVIHQQHGFKGFYRGFNLSVLLSFHGMIQMIVYEKLQKIIKGNKTTYAFINGSLAKAFSLIILYPLSTIKVRVQENQYKSITQDLQELYFKNQKYNNIFQIVQNMARKEGLLSFYKGFFVNIVRQVPQQGIFFLLYEMLKNIFL